MKKLKNIHPGEVLKAEFLDELGITAYRLAKDTGIPQTRVSEIKDACTPRNTHQPQPPQRYESQCAVVW